jgi:hypothetical protein
LLGTAEERDFTLDLTVLPIYQHDLSSLAEPFSVEEVWMTIKKTCHWTSFQGQLSSQDNFIEVAGVISRVMC